MGAGQSGTTEAACRGEGGGEHPLYLPAPPCLRSSLVARLTSLGSQHSLNRPLEPWSLGVSCGLQPHSGLEDGMVFPWEPPSVSGKHAVSITFSFREGPKQGSPGCCGNHTGV